MRVCMTGCSDPKCSICDGSKCYLCDDGYILDENEDCEGNELYTDIYFRRSLLIL